MPRRKRSARSIEVAQPACKKVFKSPLINFNLLEKEITNIVPVTTGRDNTEGLLCIGTFDLCFSHSRVILIHQEEECEEEEASPCLKRALIVVEDETVFLATWEDATLQLLKVTGLPDKELMRSLSNLHHKGLSLHITGTPSLLEMFPCKTCTSVTIDVMITGDLLVTSDPFEVPRASFRERAFYLHPLIRWLHPDFSELTECEVEYYTSGWNVALVIDEFYRRNKWRTSAECFDWYNLNVRGMGLHIAEKMFCILRPYQWRAVGWMLAREGVIVSDKTTTRIETELLDTLWSKFATNGDGVYYNRHTARFCKQLLPAGDQVTVSGGILADEMGLGKTVEVLALILANQWTGHDEHLVNQLQQQVEPLKGEGLGPACPTLAMAPPTLNERPEVVTCRQVSNSSDENQAAAHIIACVCGAMTANNYAGAWVSCDACELWYHAPCVKFDMEKQQEFVCVRCLYRPENPVACGSTLIVSPVSIAEQWLNEIDKHIKPDILKVLYYRGIKLDGYITPPEMATYDIVLTTYEVLKTEVYFSDNQKEFSRVLRHPKKYLPPRTPLSLLHWWRICLDEAQMIEGKYTNAARMVQQLSASHRWCVTGTPLQQGVHDLYGLLFFLRVEPYVADAWWKKLLWRPFLEGNWAPMLKTCSKLLWRNSKRDVADELRLPPHSECVHWLHFLPVERHFYRKTLEQSEDEFEQMIQKFCGDEGALCNFDNKTVSMLLAPLRQLRQSCCHPQLVKGGYLMGTGSTRGHVTMAKLLEQLTKKARNEVIEALRVLVTSCNGIAAVHQIKHEWQEAADMYHHVMQTWEEHTNDVISVDRLPRIHTMENLADLLDTHSDSISGRTTRDGDLRSEAKKLRDEYLAKFRGAVAVSVATLQSAKAHCKEVKEKLPDSDYWWNKALSWSCDAGVSDRLMQVVGTELDTIPGHPQTLMIRDMSGLQLVLLQEAEKLEECREEAIHLISTLLATPSAEEVEEIAACHLRPLESAPPTVCKFCKVDQVIQQLQDLVYMKMVYNTGEEYSSKADGFLERLLKCIHSFIKYQCGAQDVINEAKDYFALIEAFKKEFKAIREVWLASHGHVAALDELEMSTTRLQLRHSCDRSDSLHLLASYEVGLTMVRLKSEKMTAEQELKKLLGQLLYLDNLHKVSDIKGDNQEPCPICVKPLGCEWSMLTCGHCLCTECCGQLLRYHRHPHPLRAVGNIQCPLCRAVCRSDEIGYVSTNASNETQDDIRVEGNYSTKIRGVIMTVLSILKEHPDEKMIVFSTWSDSLSLVSSGLTKNSVRFLHGKDQKSLQQSLHQFKEDSSVKVLLLPTHSGSKGLNLTEASHVILCEPSLNIADEHQAIGRIYRMGQTRPTVVHRLYIKDTVEEKIRQLNPPDLNSDEQRKVYGELTVEDVRELMRT